ncbi:hypothetical protein IJ750_06375 [bacterium]|nr:hypothetical protein [bacterium]
MKVLSIEPKGFYYNYKQQNLQNNIKIKNNAEFSQSAIEKFRYPCNYNVSFTGFADDAHKLRSVPDIEYEDYCAMSETKKNFYRKKIQIFDQMVDKSQLVDQDYPKIPLYREKDMDDFIKISSIYNQYKDHQIICLGRSPKWFLNASCWMKDGIPGYKFVAFSGSWFYYNPLSGGYSGMHKNKTYVPSPEQIKAYRKYLSDCGVDPKSLVENYEKTGKPTILTDYISSGKGVTSFLDLLSEWSEELGLTERLSKSIKLVCIGSMEYLEDVFYDSEEEIDTPFVSHPPKLDPYYRNMPTTFYSMPRGVFYQMLYNQNANECRSTYYPYEMWTVYRPDRFKTGLIKDMKKVEDLIKQSSEKIVSSFAPGMRNYRNLLNFRILDGLNARGLLKEATRLK